MKKDYAPRDPNPGTTQLKIVNEKLDKIISLLMTQEKSAREITPTEPVREPPRDYYGPRDIL